MPRLLFALLAVAAWAHAPITPPMRGPLRVDGPRIVDSTGAPGQLRGAALPSVDAATVATLGVLRLRWNFNAVRIPLNVSEWQRDGKAYLDRVAVAIGRARDAELIVILAAGNDRNFWTACATAFRDTPNIIFSPGAPEPYSAIRATGARQIVSIPTNATVQGDNLMYEANLVVGAKDSFGTLPGRVPVYAGEWGPTNCNALPTDPRAVSDLVFLTLSELDTRGIHWTAATFEPGSLLQDTTDYEASVFENTWRCGQPGMGQTVLSWMTGDPTGFGYLRKEAIASAAGGPSSPAAPGQLLSIYIEQMGPAPDQSASLQPNGTLPTNLGGTEVLFDGHPAPILFAGQYQINVQAPPTLTPGKESILHVVYKGVPSNHMAIEVVSAAPEIFHDIFTKNAIALNENGTRNTDANPAAAGSIVVLFATGTGSTAPAATAGQPANSPHPLLTQPAAVQVDGRDAEVLFAGEVPGFVGLSQINARLPRQLPPGAAPLKLRIGANESRSPVVLQIR
jgi:uncharacterized protein (TIGR03437 family)